MVAGLVGWRRCGTAGDSGRKGRSKAARKPSFLFNESGGARLSC
ncbi:hypothetical protein ACP4OV_029037 [Aristida adscensionis]